MFSLFLAGALAGTPLQSDLSTWLTETEVAEVEGALARCSAEVAARLAKVGDSDGVAERIAEAVAVSVARKSAEHDVSGALPYTVDELKRQVVAYECFKAEAYVTAGVFPKRYFGYVDGKGDTGVDELRVAKAVVGSVAVINAVQAERGRAVRVTDAEVWATWIAEGGAWWLGLYQAQKDDLHAVMDIGLDDIALGVRDEPLLMGRLDKRVGTDLSGLVARTDAQGRLPVPSVLPQGLRYLRDDGKSGPGISYLTRNMTLEESVVGTALMWVWEKEIAERKAVAKGWGSLMDRDASDQFIAGSLVYNSGLIHSPSRWKQVRDYNAGKWMYGASHSNRHRRSELNLLAPGPQLAEWRVDGKYRIQGTSWLAGYHILQRWGGYDGLMRFTDVFDADGKLKALPTVVVPPKATAVPADAVQPAAVPPERAGGCAAVPGRAGLSSLFFVALLASARRLGRAAADR